MAFIIIIRFHLCNSDDLFLNDKMNPDYTGSLKASEWSENY